MTLNILRVILPLALIFALGVWTGRVLTQKEIQDESSASSINSVSTPGSTPARTQRNTRKVLKRYETALELNSEQKNLVKPMFIETGKAMATIARDSPERIGILTALHEKMKPLLNEKQRALCDEILRQIKERKKALADPENSSVSSQAP